MAAARLLAVILLVVIVAMTTVESQNRGMRGGRNRDYRGGEGGVPSGGFPGFPGRGDGGTFGGFPGRRGGGFPFGGFPRGGGGGRGFFGPGFRRFGRRGFVRRFFGRPAIHRLTGGFLNRLFPSQFPNNRFNNRFGLNLPLPDPVVDTSGTGSGTVLPRGVLVGDFGRTQDMIYVLGDMPYTNNPDINSPYTTDPNLNYAYINNPDINNQYTTDPNMNYPYINNPDVNNQYIDNSYTNNPNMDYPYTSNHINKPYVDNPYVDIHNINYRYNNNPDINKFNNDPMIWPLTASVLDTSGGMRTDDVGLSYIGGGAGAGGHTQDMVYILGNAPSVEGSASWDNVMGGVVPAVGGNNLFVGVSANRTGVSGHGLGTTVPGVSGGNVLYVNGGGTFTGGLAMGGKGSQGVPFILPVDPDYLPGIFSGDQPDSPEPVQSGQGQGGQATTSGTGGQVSATGGQTAVQGQVGGQATNSTEPADEENELAVVGEEASNVGVVAVADPTPTTDTSVNNTVVDTSSSPVPTDPTVVPATTGVTEVVQPINTTQAQQGYEKESEQQ